MNGDGDGDGVNLTVPSLEHDSVLQIGRQSHWVKISHCRDTQGFLDKIIDNELKNIQQRNDEEWENDLKCAWVSHHPSFMD